MKWLLWGLAVAWIAAGLYVSVQQHTALATFLLRGETTSNAFYENLFNVASFWVFGAFLLLAYVTTKRKSPKP